MTVVPLFCAKLIKGVHQGTAQQEPFNRKFHQMLDWYEARVEHAVDITLRILHREIVIVVAFGVGPKSWRDHLIRCNGRNVIADYFLFGQT